MTYTHQNVLRVLSLHNGKPLAKTPLFYFSKFQNAALYKTLVEAHTSHYLEFLCALLCYYACFLPLFPQAATLNIGWVGKVVAFNVAMGWSICGFWHYFMYISPIAHGPVQARKFNPVNQYEPAGKPVRMLRSTTGHLEREILYTTLGWTQSALWQSAFMWLWASGRVPFYSNFWANPLWSIANLAFVTYWRLFHFYWCHRMIHPWRVQWPWFASLLRACGMHDCKGDPGQFLYRHVHSLHHKSYNPGPWSGISMHPVEHVFYYSCTLWCALFAHHPLHLLYNKFHADVSAVGGHDGFGDPGGNSEYHYIHHSKFEYNYGVPLVNFDKLFGTFMDPKDWPENPNLRPPMAAVTSSKTATELDGPHMQDPVQRAAAARRRQGREAH